MEQIIFKPIGIIHSPFKTPENMPIQPKFAEGVLGKVELFEEYRDGLADLDGFSHIILLYHFHLARPYTLKVKPFLDDVKRGLFATRAPRRPNNIGLSVVKLESIEGNILNISRVDIVDGTPLLDIKPYVPGFELDSDLKFGWLEQKLKDKNI